MRSIADIFRFLLPWKSYGRFSVVSRLAKVDCFGFESSGYFANISYGAKAYRKILPRRSAEKDFKHVLKIGTPAAKCYALVGLRTLNESEFDILSAPYENDESLVNTRGYCMQWTNSLSDNLAQIRPYAHPG